MSKKFLIQLQLKMPNGEKTMEVKSDQTRSPLPLFITSHSLQHTSKLQTPADSWWMYLTLSDSPPTSQEMLPSFTCSIRLLAAQQARCAWSSPDVEQGHNLSVTAVVAGVKKNNTNPTTEAATAHATTNIAEGVHELKSCMKHSQSILRFWFPSCT